MFWGLIIFWANDDTSDLGIRWLLKLTGTVWLHVHVYIFSETNIDRKVIFQRLNLISWKKKSEITIGNQRVLTPYSFSNRWVCIFSGLVLVLGTHEWNFANSIYS